MIEDFEVELELLAQIDTLQREKDTLLTSRLVNLPQNIAAFRKQNEKAKQLLKSDLKKSNAFVKKLKLINTDGIQQCIKDTESLNLNLFVSEIVNGIVATTYKATDVSNMVKLCISLHHKYEEFGEPLITGIKQAIIAPPNEEDQEAGKRKRIQIRFIVELYQAGFFSEDEYFIRLLKNLLGKGKIASKLDLQGLGTLVKYGSETVFGYLPRKMLDLATKTGRAPESMPVKTIVNGKVAGELRALLTDTYLQLSSDLVGAHKSYHAKEAKLEKDKLIHGTITEQKQQEFDHCKKLFEKLFSIVSTLAECMGEEIPALEVEKEEEDGTGGLTVWNEKDPSVGEDLAVGGGLYGDAETRAFYEDLPDLLALVPLSILGFTPEQAAAMRELWEQDLLQQQQAQGGSDLNAGDGLEAEAVTNSTTDTADTAATGTDGNGDLEAEDNKLSADTPEAEADAEDPSDEPKSDKLLALLTEKLPECVNKQRADEFCTSFCYLNTKNARKRLVQSLIRVPRSRSELTVTYSRVIASLARLYPDIAPPVLDALRREFFGMLKTKNQTHIESKMKTVRYLGELVKFRVAPPIVAFRMYRSFFGEFSNQNAQLLAVLLETCGRYLYLLPYTHEHMVDILNTMLRLRRAKNIDLNMQTLLEAAYFAVKPPERVAKTAKKPLTTLQMYIRHLILVKVDEPRGSVEAVIRNLRRLPWKKSDEDNITLEVVKASLRLARTKYVSIPNLADCISGLGSYHPNVVVQLVDRILEEVQRGLETPYKREIQRMHGLVKLLGELYNFTAISSVIIFDLLYHLINFGHTEANLSVVLVEKAMAAVAGQTGSTSSSSSSSAVATAAPALRVTYDPRIATDLDPVTDLFRAQVVCELLNTCGMYFVKGKPKEKLSRFLVYFQRYLLTKQYIPLHVEFTILDTLDSLEEQAREAHREVPRKSSGGRGKAQEAAAVGAMFPRFETLEAAQAAVDVFELVSEEERLRQEKENEAEDEEEDAEEEGEEDEAGGRTGRGSRGGENNDNDNDSQNEQEQEQEQDQDQDQDEDEESEEQRLSAQREEDEQSERMAAKMMEKLRIAEEDDEFEKAFKHVMQESVHNVSSKNNDVNKMVIPAVLPKPKNSFRSHPDDDDQFELMMGPMMGSTGSGAGGSGGSGGGGAAGGRGVTFKLLSRDAKGRFETRQLQVPQDNQMAVKLAKAEEVMRAEKQRLKERVLQIDQLTAEAEFEASQERAQHMRALSTANTGGSIHRGNHGNTNTSYAHNSNNSSSNGSYHANTHSSSSSNAGAVGGPAGGGTTAATGTNAGTGTAGAAGAGGTNASSNAQASQYNAAGRQGQGQGQGQGNLSGVSFGGYGRVSYSSSGHVSSGRSKHVLVRAEETRKPVDTLNLDEFLAEADASDLRKISTKKTGKL